MFGLIIETYCFCALSAGILYYFNTIKPILNSIKTKYDVTHTFEIQYPVKTAFLVILVGTLLAPIILSSVLYGASEEFIESYTNRIIEK